MTTRKAPVVKAPRTPRAAATGQSEPLAAGDPVVSRHGIAAIDHGILGNEQARAALGKALASGQFPHAWIFHGPAGVGKCTMAVALAALVVDGEATHADRVALTPRRVGRAAELLRAGTHPDVRIIRADLASTSADRTLRDRKQANIPVGILREHMIGGGERGGPSFEAPVHRSSVMGCGKVFIIDGAERLETEGQNVLLKTLEEPPAGTVIILVTTSVDRLLPTIRSRCQRVAFHPLPEAVMAQWLDANLAEVTGDARTFLESFADGSPGSALTAAQLGMQAWHAELLPMIDRVVKGECPTAMPERMHEIASEVSEAAVKKDPRASKEAATRRAVGLLFSLIGAEVRRRMAAATSSVAALDYWSQIPKVIARAESNISANVNLKLALADFVAQWSQVRGSLR